MAMRGPRHPIGAASWITEERTTALHIARSEVDEFSFSAKNEMDWLNEHMAEIFSENQINVADIFKTPGKLRGRTPRTARKADRGDIRAPLTDVFSSTPKGTNPFSISKLTSFQQQQRRQSPTFKVAEDRPIRRSRSPRASLAKARGHPSVKTATATTAAPTKTQPTRKEVLAASLADSGYHGSQSQESTIFNEVDEEDGDDVEDVDEDLDDLAMSAAKPRAHTTRPLASGPAQARIAAVHATPTARAPATTSTRAMAALEISSDDMVDPPEPVEPLEPPESTFHSAQEDQPADTVNLAVATSPIASSSPMLVPVHSPSPIRLENVSPRRKPVPIPAPVPAPVPAAQSQPEPLSDPQTQAEPSSPMQSTTPGCPPPPELLAAMGHILPPVAESPSPAPTPMGASVTAVTPHMEAEAEAEASSSSPQKQYEDLEDELEDGAQTPDSSALPGTSSPVRAVVRKSSLNFASLPAREPFTSNKSMGGAARMSRTSHFNRVTSGKSLGVHVAEKEKDEEEEEKENDEMDVDDVDKDTDTDTAAHSKTYTQRLQDRISMLGKSQANAPRPSKSLASHLPGALTLAKDQSQLQPTLESSPRRNVPGEAPGAFPEEDDNDWILPPPDATTTSPRLNVPKAFASMDMEMEMDVNVNVATEMPAANRPEKLERLEVVLPKQSTAVSPSRVFSGPVLALSQQETGQKPVPAPIPTSASKGVLAVVAELESQHGSPRTPARMARDGPLRQVKSKLSSIIKSSRGLLASSAAISAEGKSSLLSPSASRLGIEAGYPDLSRTPAFEAASQPAEAFAREPSPLRENSPMREASPVHNPVRPPVRKTRASAERERKEQKLREKETKETQRAVEQMEKLEKMREKEREKARLFNEEQEKQEKRKPQHEHDGDLDMDDFALRPVAQEPPQLHPLPPPPPQQAAASPIRVVSKTATTMTVKPSPRKARPNPAEADAEVAETTTRPTMHAPSHGTSSVPRTAAGGRMIRRPMKPTKEAPGKTKQAPTVIRVNTTSTQQSQLHPSNSVLAMTLHETLASGPGPNLKGKASVASLHAKPSLQSLKSSVSSTGRPKALDLAARRKEQEEREAARKAAAAQQRQAAIEKAKQTRAPPPAPRTQLPSGPSGDFQQHQPARPQSRLATASTTSTMHRTQEDGHRPVNAVLSNTGKAQSKRPLPTGAPKEAKRIRMSEEFDEDELEIGGGGGSHMPRGSSIRGPPVRPSGGFKKDLTSKSLFGNGYATVPGGANGTRDLFKTASQLRPGHPLDMAQVSKAPIPFAAAGGAGSQNKTPARPMGPPVKAVPSVQSAAKSRSSPRYPNGDGIELPEIQTDDEDSDEDGPGENVAPWADSPDLRRALMQQETMDPMQVFGPPRPLNMEEVFSKSKDRWNKFRARTSSANWSGSDRLTEEDIRKDLAARDRIRRDGGWTYELNREMM